MQMIADGRSKNMEWGWCECRNGPIRSFRQKRGGGVGRGERGYERRQGIRMSQEYGRCRNGKRRLRQK